MVALALAALVFGAASLDEAPSESAIDQPLTVWAQPIAAGVISGMAGMAYAPLGATYRVTPGFALSLELSVWGQQKSCVAANADEQRSINLNGCRASLLGGAVTVGPVVHPFRGALPGLFVQLKLMFAFSQERGQDHGSGDEDHFHAGDTLEGGVGLDVGYEWRWRRLVLAPVIGVGGGYSTRQSSALRSVAFLSTDHQVPSWFFAPNFNLLRVGVAF